eukprot:IDg5087t1
MMAYFLSDNLTVRFCSLPTILTARVDLGKSTVDLNSSTVSQLGLSKFSVKGPLASMVQ